MTGSNFLMGYQPSLISRSSVVQLHGVNLCTLHVFFIVQLPVIIDFQWNLFGFFSSYSTTADIAEKYFVTTVYQRLWTVVLILDLLKFVIYAIQFLYETLYPTSVRNHQIHPAERMSHLLYCCFNLLLSCISVLFVML
jgi:hypothetical protein